MAYKALYRKYRPTSFEEVVGQEHITKTLAAQVKSGSIGHAYLFTGTRGTGKTSTAKIFSKAINCSKNLNGSPCYECEVCRSLDDPSNMDVLEIDAASNNRVDEIRDIREKVKFLPVNGKYKVYIIDEVHMLTESAFNALLKTLEEPPSHVVFILATTEVHKLPATILSRCMRFDFRLVGTEVLVKLLKSVFNKENIKFTEDALKAIALAGEGSVRDTLSIADCINAFCDGNITLDSVQKVLGTNDVFAYNQLAESIADKNIGKALTLIKKANDEGKNLIVFAKDLTTHFRNLLVMKNCENSEEMLSLTSEIYSSLKELASKFSSEDLMEYMKIFSAIESELKYAISPRTLLETAIITAISEVGGDVKKNEI